MTSTDNISKPLKTVETLLAAVYLAGTENGLGRSITDPKEIVHRREAFIKANPVCKEIKADLYQLMLSLVGEDEGVVSADDIEDFDVHRLAVERTKIGRNKLRAELRKKLSEHFNGEGEV